MSTTKLNRRLDGRNHNGVFSTGPAPKPNGKPPVITREQLVAELTKLDTELCRAAPRRIGTTWWNRRLEQRRLIRFQLDCLPPPGRRKPPTA